MPLEAQTAAAQQRSAVDVGLGALSIEDGGDHGLELVGTDGRGGRRAGWGVAS